MDNWSHFAADTPESTPGYGDVHYITATALVGYFAGKWMIRFLTSCSTPCADSFIAKVWRSTLRDSSGWAEKVVFLTIKLLNDEMGKFSEYTHQIGKYNKLSYNGFLGGGVEPIGMM